MEERFDEVSEKLEQTADKIYNETEEIKITVQEEMKNMTHTVNYIGKTLLRTVADYENHFGQKLFGK